MCQTLAPGVLILIAGMILAQTHHVRAIALLSMVVTAAGILHGITAEEDLITIIATTGVLSMAAQAGFVVGTLAGGAYGRIVRPVH